MSLGGDLFLRFISYLLVLRTMSLFDATEIGDLPRVRKLVEQGGDVEKTNDRLWTPLMWASYLGHLEVVRYFLEQGANTKKADAYGFTSLHYAARKGHLEIAKLLMFYEADLNARDDLGRLPIDMTYNEEVAQAIRDEPERRRDQQPRKRCIEENQHHNAATSASAQQEEQEHMSKQPAEKETQEGEIADEDQDSEPSSDEGDN